MSAMFQFQCHVEKIPEQLALTCAQEAADVLRQATRNRGRAFLALSGGKSPQSFFRRFFAQSLDWSLVTIVPVDERWVALSHEASNEKMIRESLSNTSAAEAQWVSLYDPEISSAFKAQPIIENKLVNLLPNELDLTVLGMGEDGHTASWFSKSPQRDRCFTSHHRCEAVEPVTAEYERMTLTTPYLLKSRKIFMYAPGAKKIAALSLALQRQDPAEYPVTQIFQHPHLHWWTSSLP